MHVQDIEKSITSGILAEFQRNTIALIPLNIAFYLCMKRWLICSLLLAFWHCNS